MWLAESSKPTIQEDEIEACSNLPITTQQQLRTNPIQQCVSHAADERFDALCPLRR
jgi:hypothetical protein